MEEKNSTELPQTARLPLAFDVFYAYIAIDAQGKQTICGIRYFGDTVCQAIYPNLPSALAVKPLIINQARQQFLNQDIRLVEFRKAEDFGNIFARPH